MMNAMRSTTSALLLCFAIQLHAQQSQRPPTAAELRDWGSADECVRAGKRAGFNYPNTLDRAMDNDPAALATLFRFTDSGWCDGAAAEGHAQILFGLLQYLGDRRFASVLRAQKKPVRKAVFNEICAFPEWKPTAFPLTNGAR
jgi:hypothetical protein